MSVRYLLDLEKLEHSRKQDFRDLVKTMHGQFRGGSEEDQIAFATYFFHLSEHDEEARRWRGYREHLLAQRAERLRVEIEQAVIVETSASEDERSRARATIAALERGTLAEALPAGRSMDGDSIETLKAGLSDDDPRTRRAARRALSNQGLGLLAPALTELTSTGGLTYRVRLGLVVALTEMMRDNKRSREALVKQISPDALGVLLDAAVDPDRTLRIHASEFLFDLGDPRAFDAAITLSLIHI
mgnify:CR=1 FL=1